MTLSKQSSSGAKINIPIEKQRSYSEIIEWLDKNWTTVSDTLSVQAAKKLDKALGSITAKLPIITVTGTNGKSLTVHFISQLLKSENIVVGAYYSPHILTYNERFNYDGETISNKKFTDLGNELLNLVEAEGLSINTQELLLVMALQFFSKNNAHVVVIEVDQSALASISALCSSLIIAITRITTDHDTSDAAPVTLIAPFLELVKNNTHVVSADQSKANLQTMADIVQQKGGSWDMPIRKLAPLEYPFEQLHGRCAALAERIARIYINRITGNTELIVPGNSLLSKQKGRRGRPTLEAKRQSELNPKKTLDQFWRDNTTTLAGRFQILDKEKPSILLDNANNIDAFKNLLLGIRLLHYQRPLKGLTLIIGCDNPLLNVDELLKLLRYFFKKTSGSAIFCPATSSLEDKASRSWDPEEIMESTKMVKLKAKASKSFKEAFRMACKATDERNGLVVITGSSAIISEYWLSKGVKKL